MSVLIKDVEMPKCCLECLDSGLRTAIKCNEWTKISSGLRQTRRTLSCPLVELPEYHSRLLEENKVLAAMNRAFVSHEQRPTYSDVYLAIADVDTAVEA